MPSNRKRPACANRRTAKEDQATTPITIKNTRATAIEQAATWYAANRSDCPRPIVPHLRLRFGLTAAEAVRALGRAGG